MTQEGAREDRPVAGRDYPRISGQGGNFEPRGQCEAGSIGEREPQRASPWPESCHLHTVGLGQGFNQQRVGVTGGSAKLAPGRGGILACVGKLREHLCKVDDADRGTERDRLSDDARSLLVVKQGSAPRHREPTPRSAVR